MTEHEAGRKLDALVAEEVMKQRVISDEQAPPYSTDIATAWEVVEEMLGYTQWLGSFQLWDSRESWAASFDIGHGNHTFSRARTAPLAICLAALKTSQMRMLLAVFPVTGG